MEVERDEEEQEEEKKEVEVGSPWAQGILQSPSLL